MTAHRPKPTVTPEIIERFKAYHNAPNNGAWGSLHIVLDDGNIEDKHIEFCIKNAVERKDGEGAELAKLLLAFTKTQRIKIRNRA